MAVPERFYIPWNQVNGATSLPGGFPGELGDFVAADLGDNAQTRNSAAVRLYDAVQEVATTLSTHPYADLQGYPERSMVEESLLGCNSILQKIVDRTQASSDSLYKWVHRTPPYRSFGLMPIRYPVRNPFLSEVVFNLIGLLGEIAEANANTLHRGFDIRTGRQFLRTPLLIKSDIARDFFDIEVAGEISDDELRELFTGITTKVVPRPGDTASAPSAEAVAEAMAGVAIIDWQPSDVHWAVFGKKRDSAFDIERITQPEAGRTTTEDALPTGPVDPANPAVPTA